VIEGRRRAEFKFALAKGFERPTIRNGGRTMAVLREWRAMIRRDLKDEYVNYVKATGLAGYLSTPGNLGASVAVRDIDDERAEIVTLSWWTDVEAIRAFAGQNFEIARYYHEDDRFLLTRPERVLHYDATTPVQPLGVR
jgi:heme-degrading monooxygenase HmoA